MPQSFTLLQHRYVILGMESEERVRVRYGSSSEYLFTCSFAAYAALQALYTACTRHGVVPGVELVRRGDVNLVVGVTVLNATYTALRRYYPEFSRYIGAGVPGRYVNRDSRTGDYVICSCRYLVEQQEAVAVHAANAVQLSLPGLVIAGSLLHNDNPVLQERETVMLHTFVRTQGNYLIYDTVDGPVAIDAAYESLLTSCCAAGIRTFSGIRGTARNEEVGTLPALLDPQPVLRDIHSTFWREFSASDPDPGGDLPMFARAGCRINPLTQGHTVVREILPLATVWIVLQEQVLSTELFTVTMTGFIERIHRRRSGNRDCWLSDPAHHMRSIGPVRVVSDDPLALGDLVAMTTRQSRRSVAVRVATAITLQLPRKAPDVNTNALLMLEDLITDMEDPAVRDNPDLLRTRLQQIAVVAMAEAPDDIDEDSIPDNVDDEVIPPEAEAERPRVVTVDLLPDGTISGRLRLVRTPPTSEETENVPPVPVTEDVIAANGPYEWTPVDWGISNGSAGRLEAVWARYTNGEADL